MTTISHSSTDDLLKIFDSFSVPEDNHIPQADLKFCERQQELLYTTLDGIRRWYDIFCKEAEKFAESHVLSYKTDGTLTFREHYREPNNVSPDYTKFDFKPFEIINNLTKQRKNAVCAFAANIIRFFNDRYSVSVSFPEIDADIPLDFRPVYTDYTKLVEQHLHGRGFRETAEEETVSRFHTLVNPYRGSNPPELKSDKIVFHRLLGIVDSYHSSRPAYRIDYGCDRNLDTLCEGILYGSKTLLTGNSKIIQHFNYLDVDINRWYSLTFANGYAIKFYKNRRIDVRFPDAAKAKRCFERLQLNKLEKTTK